MPRRLLASIAVGLGACMSFAGCETSPALELCETICECEHCSDIGEQLACAELDPGARRGLRLPIRMASMGALRRERGPLRRGRGPLFHREAQPVQSGVRSRPALRDRRRLRPSPSRCLLLRRHLQGPPVRGERQSLRRRHGLPDRRGSLRRGEGGRRRLRARSLRAPEWAIRLGAGLPRRAGLSDEPRPRAGRLIRLRARILQRGRSIRPFPRGVRSSAGKAGASCAARSDSAVIRLGGNSR